MLFISGFALAQTFDATPGKVRTYEVEAWRTMRTEESPWGTDWKVPEFQVWAGILACKMGEKRVETCTWQDGKVYWGSGATPETVRSYAIPNTGEMRVRWGARGQLNGWDVEGKGRQEFWEAASNTQLKGLYHRKDVVYTPDSIRQIGQRLEESLLKSTVGWLEVQWAKKPQDTWAPRNPITGPRYLTNGIASHKLDYRILPDKRWVLEGKIVESYQNGTVETAAAAVYVWDGNRMVGMVGDAIHFSSTVMLTGHRRVMVQMLEATPESNPAPDRAPEAILNTQ